MKRWTPKVVTLAAWLAAAGFGGCCERCGLTTVNFKVNVTDMSWSGIIGGSALAGEPGCSYFNSAGEARDTVPLGVRARCGTQEWTIRGSFPLLEGRQVRAPPALEILFAEPAAEVSCLLTPVVDGVLHYRLSSDHTDVEAALSMTAEIGPSVETECSAIASTTLEVNLTGRGEMHQEDRQTCAF